MKPSLRSMRFSWLIGVVGVLLASCASLPEVAEGSSVSEYRKVKVGWGPEDFDLDKSGTLEYPRLLVACDERREGVTQGEIWEVDLTDFKSRKLDVIFKDSTNFHPHGVCSFGAYFFVISHNDKEEEFYRFLVEDDRLYEDTVYTKGVIGHGNDLFVVGPDEFYYSDFKMLGGSIVHYFEGEWEKEVKHLKYPNGVYVMGDVVYFTTTLQNKVFAYEEQSGKKEKIAKVKGGDNLMYDETNLYTTSHPSNFKFIKHYKSPENKSPSVVYEIGYTGNKVIYSNSGDEISAASAAWKYNDYLIIGQVFDNFLWIGKVED